MKKTANICQYKVGINAIPPNFVCLWKCRMQFEVSRRKISHTKNTGVKQRMYQPILLLNHCDMCTYSQHYTAQLFRVRLCFLSSQDPNKCGALRKWRLIWISVTYRHNKNTLQEHQRIRTFARVSEASHWSSTMVVHEKNIGKHR